MKKSQLQLKNVLALLAAASLFCFVQPSRAQSAPAQDNRDDKTVQDNDITRNELARFDQFLDSHPEIAEQLRKDPSLVNNKEFVEKHAALQTFLQQQPGVREELKENPNAFMRQENRFDRVEDARDRDTTRPELARFDQFLDSHREIAEQLRKDPSLVNNREFVEKHAALQTFLQQQPGVREELRENPTAFMRQENKFDRREDAGDRDTTRAELARFDQFLDSHHEIAEQLHKDPSLVNNREFVEKHPALQTYLQQQPGVREELRENPNAFMRQENNFDRREEATNRDTRQDDRFDRRDDARDRDTHERFRSFLGEHDNIAKDLSRDPSLAKNHEYMEHHPELQAYLKENTDVRDDLMKNPQSFVKSAQPPNQNNNGWTAPQTQPLDPKAPAPSTKQK